MITIINWERLKNISLKTLVTDIITRCEKEHMGDKLGLQINVILPYDKKLHEKVCCAK